MRARAPRVLFTSHWDDPHPDHAATARLVREAARLATLRLYDEETGTMAIKMPAIAHSVFSRLTIPSFIVDVSDFVEEKMKAIRAHQFGGPEELRHEDAPDVPPHAGRVQIRVRAAGSTPRICSSAESSVHLHLG